MKTLFTFKIDKKKKDDFLRAARSFNKYGSEILMQEVEKTISVYEEKTKRERD